MEYRTISVRKTTKQEWNEFIAGLDLTSQDAVDLLLAYHIRSGEHPADAGRRLRHEVEASNE
jgi:antitoxin component of RelBE/YafQ-DinJ toxin-antitoxin module